MYDNLQLEPSSTVDRAADELRRALFAGELAPGTPLREVALSEAMGVGRSTIREALGILVADGMAVRIPNRGVAVKELSATDIHDVIRARLVLESAGMRAWPQATKAHRQELHDALARYIGLADGSTDSGVLTEAHLQIHRALVGLTASSRLLAAADAIAAEIRLGLAHLDRVRGNIVEQVREHQLLVSLLESGDIDEALHELHRHLEAAERSLLDATGHGRLDP